MALLARAFDLARILPDHPLLNLIQEQVVLWHNLHSSKANKDTSRNSPTDSESRGRCTQCGKVDLKVHAVFITVPNTCGGVCCTGLCLSACTAVNILM